MKLPRPRSAFSLVEVTLALGVASFSLIAVTGLLPVGVKTQQKTSYQASANNITSQIVSDLRAAVRTRPPPSSSHNFSVNLPPNRGGPWNPTPSSLFFNIDGTPAASNAVAAFAVNINYTSSTSTTALADITISWPAAQTNSTKVTGSLETVALVKRAVP